MFTAIYIYNHLEGGKDLLLGMGIGALCYLVILLITRLGRTKKGFLTGLGGLCIVSFMCDIIWHLMYIEYVSDSGEQVFTMMPGFIFWPLFLVLMLLLVNIVNKMFE